MNIFALDRDPVRAARAQCDKHVVKMPLEAAQMLCTALRLAGYTGPLTYAPTHERHPCTVWTAKARANFVWLARHGLALVEEHASRYAHTKAGKRGHAAGPVIRDAMALEHIIPVGDLTPFAQAMPEHLRGPDPVEAYRRYYLEEKSSIATWRSPASRPDWMVAGDRLAEQLGAAAVGPA